MASIYNKIKIRTSVNGRNKFHFNPTHITTSDFFHLQPVFVKQVVPDTDITLSADLFSRMQPLVRPTFGRADFKLRAFYVPYYLIQRSFRDMIEGVQHVFASGSSPDLVTTKRYIYSNDLYKLLGNEAYSQFYGTSSNQENYDIQLQSLSGDHIFFKFNSRGRVFYKVLQSLGYQFPCKEVDANVEIKLDALPLLAYAKIYLDWYYPSQYVGDSFYTEVASILEFDDIEFALSTNQLHTIFTHCMFSNYLDDYFTSAFDSPLGPDNGVVTPDLTIYDQDKTTDFGQAYVTNTTELGIGGTPYLDAEDTHTFSQFLLNSLKRLTDYFRRAQFVGARVSDRYKAHFGVDISDPHRSAYFGSQDIPVQIGDVFATADTEGSTLADFAGRGFAAGNNKWQIKCPDFGIVIVCMSLIPRVGYSQGIDRELLSVDMQDIYNPDFDGLGCQAISRSELVVGQDGTALLGDITSPQSKGVFGFTPRFSHLKVMLDRLTGDFNCRSINTGLDSWHLQRKFAAHSLITASMVHSRGFISGRGTYEDALGNTVSQYDRIFANTDAYDHFMVFLNFDCVMYSIYKPMYDMYEFDNDRGKEEIVKLNGGNVN